MNEFCIVILTIENYPVLYRTLRSIDKRYKNLDIYLVDNSKNPEVFEYKSENNNIFYYSTKIGYTGVGKAKEVAIDLLKDKLINYANTYIQDDDCLITKDNTYYILSNLLLNNPEWGVLGSIGEKRGWLIDVIVENPTCVIPVHTIGTIMVFRTELLLKIKWDAELKVSEDVDSVLQIISMGYMSGIVDVGTSHKRHRRLEKEYGEDIWAKNKILMTKRNSELLKPNSFINKNTLKTKFMHNKYFYDSNYKIIKINNQKDEVKLL